MFTSAYQQLFAVYDRRKNLHLRPRSRDKFANRSGENNSNIIITYLSCVCSKYLKNTNLYWGQFPEIKNNTAKTTPQNLVFFLVLVWQLLYCWSGMPSLTRGLVRSFQGSYSLVQISSEASPTPKRSGQVIPPAVQLSVGQSVHLSVGLPSGAHDHIIFSESCGFLDVGRLIWREEGSVVYSYSCFWGFPAQLLPGSSLTELVTIFYCHCLVWDSPNLLRERERERDKVGGGSEDTTIEGGRKE
jgi:hypothetical protein